jgi:hypothetical protein
MATFDSRSILIDRFLDRLEASYARLYGGQEPECRSVIRTTGMMAMEILAGTDALYHNAEHSMMVTLVGQEILRGKQLREGGVGARDWAHFIVSLLCHDIGYVRGICPGDGDGVAVIAADGRTVAIPPGATDAFLSPYHIERGKLFVGWRFRDHPVIDPEVAAANIERTRFPVPSGDGSGATADYPGLARAADLIGQLADPDYRRKLVALFHEFEETGANRETGYESPDDMREGFPDFFRKMVHPYIGPGLAYLRATRDGRWWEASLYSHIFAEKHRHVL